MLNLDGDTAICENDTTEPIKVRPVCPNGEARCRWTERVCDEGSVKDGRRCVGCADDMATPSGDPLICPEIGDETEEAMCRAKRVLKGKRCVREKEESEE